MQRLIVCQILFVILLIPALCRPSLAHKVRIFAWQDGGNIVTESKFSGGRPAQSVTVSVTDSESGEKLLSGTSDSEGLFSFPLPTTGAKELQITVDGGDGHKNSWHYTLETTSSPPSSSGKSVLPLSEEAEVTQDKSVQPITASELTRIIETTLDKKLAPITRTLAENSEQDPTLQDILGGIGYILGLAGIAAYMQSLRNKKGGGS